MTTGPDKPTTVNAAPAPAGKLQPMVLRTFVFMTDREEADILLALKTLARLGLTSKVCSADADDNCEQNCSPLLISFVQGAAWWEWQKENATMWQGDRLLAEKEAVRREKNGTLGVLQNASGEGREV